MCVCVEFLGCECWNVLCTAERVSGAVKMVLHSRAKQTKWSHIVGQNDYFSLVLL